MKRQLVFVHGRSQQDKDAVALKKEWIDAWKIGLAKGGLSLPLPEENILFPYYGNTLIEMAGGMSTEEAARIVVRAEYIDREAEHFIRDYLTEIQDKAGISDKEVLAELDEATRHRGVLNWGWVQGILSVLDRKVPGASGTSVALFTRDVYQYLYKPKIRKAINDGVRLAINPDIETVVVGHSLGTVVAYDVLKNRPEGAEINVPLFVTLGSPLAIQVIKKMLRPIGHPGRVAKWYNAMDERDVVSLFPLDSRHFNVDPEIENKTDVDNPTSNRHGISGYLCDPVVARRIYEALTTG